MVSNHILIAEDNPALIEVMREILETEGYRVTCAGNGNEALKAFEAAAMRPRAGEMWRFAACRYDYSKDFEAPELSSTANVRGGSFHSYEDYAELKFVGAR